MNTWRSGGCNNADLHLFWMSLNCASVASNLSQSMMALHVSGDWKIVWNRQSLVGWSHVKWLDGYFPRWTLRARPPWPTPSPRVAPPGSTTTCSPPQSPIDLQKRRIRLNLKVFVYLLHHISLHCWTKLCTCQIFLGPLLRYFVWISIKSNSTFSPFKYSGWLNKITRKTWVKRRPSSSLF